MTERELRILRTLADEVRAIRQEMTAIHQDQSNDRISRVEIQAEPITQSAIRDYYEAANRSRKSWWGRYQPVIETSGVAIAFFLAFLALLQTPSIIESAGAAKSAASTAAATLSRSTQQFRTDERAWITIEPFTPKLLAPASEGFGTFFEYELYPKNVGKTVANNIVVRAFQGGVMSGLSQGDNADQIGRYHQQLLRGGFGKDAEDDKAIIFRRVPKFLGPGSTSSAPFKMTDQEPQSRGAIFDFLIGRIDYDDAFDVHHWMRFCFFVLDRRGNIEYCREGNDTDKNPEVEPGK